MSQPGLGSPRRLWRARHRHDCIDAIVTEAPDACELEFRRNGKSLVRWRFATRNAATAEATRRLRDLQRVGWTDHW